MKNQKLNKMMDKAGDLVKSNKKIKGLLETVRSKIEQITHDSDKRRNFVSQLRLITRMIQMHFRGEYKSFSTQTILILVFGLIYFITPVDLIPDFIPALGLADDISIIYFILRNLEDDVQRFRVWEQSKPG